MLYSRLPYLPPCSPMKKARGVSFLRGLMRVMLLKSGRPGIIPSLPFFFHWGFFIWRKISAVLRHMLHALLEQRGDMIVCQGVEHGFAIAAGLDQFGLLEQPKLVRHR